MPINAIPDILLISVIIFVFKKGKSLLLQEMKGRGWPWSDEDVQMEYLNFVIVGQLSHSQTSTGFGSESDFLVIRPSMQCS
jgi:hypothetical protein